MTREQIETIANKWTDHPYSDWFVRDLAKEWLNQHERIAELEAEVAKLRELCALSRDVIDDELDGHAARHSLGMLYARLNAAI